MSWRYLITGATGFLGSHVAEACRSKGHPVSTIARAGSETSLLEKFGVTIHRGDLTQPDVVRQAVHDADVIVHCAAKVGDTGPVEDYRPVNVEALRSLLEACKNQPLQRFVQMSSLGVYEAHHHHGTDETEPLPDRHMDSYTTTKVEADKLALEYHRTHQIPVVVLRPGFIYRPRDRTFLPKLIERMTRSKVHYLGGEQLALNTIYVGNLVDAVFLAVEKPEAIGQVYNLTDGETVNKRQFIEAVGNRLGVPPSKQILPKRIAALVVRLLERQIRRATAAGRKPLLTPATFKFMLLNLDFSIEKARRELGYRPRVTFEEGMRQTMAWFQQKA